MAKVKEITEEIVKLADKGLSATEIANSLNVWRQTVYKKLNKIGRKIPNYHNSLKFDNTVFDNIDTEEKAYWLGFMYADGHVSTNSNMVELCLKGDDIEHLNKYNDFIKNQKSVKLSKVVLNGKEYSRCRCMVANKHYHNRLIELGCIPKKSLVLQFPNKNIFSDFSLIKHFIRGYVDGDGCLTYTKDGRLVVEIMGTKEFLTGIISLYPEYFTTTFHKDKRKPLSNTYFISCACDKADSFATILYENSNIYLDRKYNRFAVLRRNS